MMKDLTECNMKYYHDKGPSLNSNTTQYVGLFVIWQNYDRQISQSALLNCACNDISFWTTTMLPKPVVKASVIPTEEITEAFSTQTLNLGQCLF